MLRMDAVSKRFHRGRETVVAVHEADLEVSKGEFVSLVGPSGSGKSTLLHLAGGLDKPDSGTVWLDGQDLAHLSTSALARLRRRHVGFVFQFFHLIPNLTVAENVALPLVLDRKRHHEAAVDELIARVGLESRSRHLPAELSGGEMQRAAIARALINDPPLILADEPTGNLDSATGEGILDLLAQQVRLSGAALVMVTHNPTAGDRAGRVLTLRDGRLTQTGAGVVGPTEKSPLST